MPRRTPPRPVLRRNGGPFRVFPVVLQKIVGRHAEELRQSHNLLHVGRRLSALSFRNGLATHPKLFGKLLLGHPLFFLRSTIFSARITGFSFPRRTIPACPICPAASTKRPLHSANRRLQASAPGVSRSGSLWRKPSPVMVNGITSLRLIPPRQKKDRAGTPCAVLGDSRKAMMQPKRFTSGLQQHRLPRAWP